MMTKISYAAYGGRAYQWEQRKNKTVVVGMTWKTHSAVVIASGAEHGAYVREGARSAALAALAVLEQMGAQWLMEGDIADVDAIAAEILTACRIAQSRNGFPLAEQACSLQFCVGTEEGTYLCGILGGGSAFAASSVLLVPVDPGEQEPDEVYITSPEALQRFRLSSGQLFSEQSVVLFSGSMSEALYRQEPVVCEGALCRIAGWMCMYQEEQMNHILEIALENQYSGYTDRDTGIAVFGYRRSEPLLRV